MDWKNFYKCKNLYDSQWGILLLFATSIIHSCSSNTYNLDGGNLTRSEVGIISRKISETVEINYPLVKHKRLTQYIDSLGQALVARNSQMPPLAYEFRVLKTSEAFSFTLPGGITYISLGMIRQVDLEAQLASVIAHELAHQFLNHPLIVWRKRVNESRGEKTKLEFNGPWQISYIGPDGFLKLSEAMDEEADRLAPILMYRGKFDPRAYLSHLQLLASKASSQPKIFAQYQMLHSSFEKRIKWSKIAISKLPPLKDPTLNSESFTSIKATLKELENRSPVQKK